MTSLSRRFGALLALLALLSGLPQSMLVLCVGEDGHVAVGIAGESAAPAGTPPPQGGFALADRCSCGDGCGPCQDCGLGLDDLGGFFRSSRAAAVLPPAAAHLPDAEPGDWIHESTFLLI